MKLKVLAVLAVALLASAVVALTTAPTAASQTTIPINSACTLTQGTASTADDLAGTFVGTLEVTRFAVQNGQLVLRGTLSGTCTAISDATQFVTINNQAVNIPVLDLTAQQSCRILDLTLGPLHLDLLGLVVDLSQVDLDITAVPGAGNLLGNLLCAIAGLLDQGQTNLVSQLLNQLLGRGLIQF
jgi:hypothetical protein